MTAKERFFRNDAKALGLKAKILNSLKKLEDHLQPSIPQGSPTQVKSTEVTAQVLSYEPAKCTYKLQYAKQTQIGKVL